MLGKPFVSLYFCRGDLIYGESLVDRTEPPSFFVCCFPWITLLHLSTQMRYANSKRGLYRSRVGPRRILLLFCPLLVLRLLLNCSLIQPHPRIILRLGVGQGVF